MEKAASFCYDSVRKMYILSSQSLNTIMLQIVERIISVERSEK